MEKIKGNWYKICLAAIFILAIILRVKTYLLARPLWHDECALAMSILNRDIFEFFQPLDYEQKAPAIFMMLNKSVSGIFGISELSLKFVPFLSGIFSIFVFYILSQKVLKNKVNLLLANYLFAINYQLIYWGEKFKPYSFDVLMFIGSLLLFSKLNLDKISYKRCILYSLTGLLFSMASFPCIFILGAYILFCIFKKTDIKKISLFCAPLIILYLLYYFKSLHNVQSSEIANYAIYWELGFLKFNLPSVLTVFRENFNFFFTPNNFALMGFILFVWGLVLTAKDKEKSNESLIILLCFAGIILVSFLRIYPIWQRTALYLLPICILLISKPLDLISKEKKIKSTVVILFFAAFFSKYNFSYVSSFLKPDAFLKTDALTAFPELVKKHDNQDILVINSTTKADFIYYSKIYGFKPKRLILLPIYRYKKEDYYNFLNSLPRGNVYWFIFGWEYSHHTERFKDRITENLMDYIKDNRLQIIEKRDDGNSLLIKVKI